MRPELFPLLLLVCGCLFMGCGSNPTGVDYGGQFKASNTLEQNVAGISRVKLSSEIGNVEIKPASQPLLKVIIEKVVRYGTKELAAELFEKVNVTARNEQGTVYIETVGMEAVKGIIAKYQQVVDPAKVTFEINYILEVPTNLNHLNISTRVGNISLTDLTGVFELTAVTGNIALKNNMSVTGKSSVVTNTGNIEARIQQIQSTAEFKAETQTGNINLWLSNPIICTLDIEQYMQENQIIQHNGGGVLIKTKAVMGIVNYQFY